MIELPEAVVIARQMAAELSGKRIVAGTRGNSPHKFAFYSAEPEEYAAILPGKTLGPARDNGNKIMLPVEPGYIVVLGEGGERILYHKNASTLRELRHAHREGRLPGRNGLFPQCQQ